MKIEDIIYDENLGRIARYWIEEQPSVPGGVWKTFRYCAHFGFLGRVATEPLISIWRL